MNPNPHLHRVTWLDDPLYNDPVYDATEGLLRRHVDDPEIMNPNPNAHLHRVTWLDDPLYNDPVYDAHLQRVTWLDDPLYNDPVYDVTEGLLRRHVDDPEIMNPNPNAHLHPVTWPRDDPLYNDPVYDVTEGLVGNVSPRDVDDPVFDVTKGLPGNISPDDDLTADEKLIRGCGSWDSDREVGIAGHSDNSAQPFVLPTDEDILPPPEKQGEAVDVDSIKDKKNFGQEQGMLNYM